MLNREAAREQGVKIRILTPEDVPILETEQNLMIVKKEQRGAISYIQPHLQTKANVMIVDKKYLLAIGLTLRCCLTHRYYLKVFGHKPTCINN